MAEKAKKQSKVKPPPHRVFGFWSDVATADEYFRIDEDPGVLVEKGETLRVAVYQFIGYSTVTNATEVIENA